MSTEKHDQSTAATAGCAAATCSVFAGVELRKGDSIEVLQTIPASHVDAVVTNPPYMIGAISTGDSSSKAGSWVDLMNASFWYREWMGECWPDSRRPSEHRRKDNDPHQATASDGRPQA